jgi:hypothetical protein
VDNEHAHVNPEILMAAKDTVEDGNGVKFKKKFITMLKGSHYTALVRNQDKWLHYDGMSKGQSKYRFAHPNDFTKAKASDMYYFRQGNEPQDPQ